MIHELNQLEPHERTALIWALLVACAALALMSFVDRRDERMIQQWHKEEAHAHHQRH